MRPPLVLAAIVPAAALYLATLSILPLGASEARSAEVAREMWAGGRALDVPRLNGAPAVGTPPLSAWTAAAAMAAAGDPVPPEWAARLPAALFTLATAAAVFLLGRGWFSTRHGVLAALVFLLSPLAIESGRRISAEPAAAFAVTVAAGSALTALRAVRQGRFWAFVGCVAGGTALGFLAAGLLAPALAAAAVAGAIVAERGARGFFTLRTLLLVLAGLAGLALALGIWLHALNEAGGGALIRAHFDRTAAALAGGEGAAPGRARPFWFYLAAAPLGLLPWLAFAPFAGLGRAHGLAPGKHPEFPLRQLVAWAALPLVALSIAAEKRAGFALPIVPPLALLAACAILEPPREGRAATAVRGLWIVLLLGLLLGGTVFPLIAAGVAASSGGAALAGVALAAAGALAAVLSRRDPEERESPLPYPIGTAALGAVLALALAISVEPLSARARRTLRPLGRAAAAAIAAEPGARPYGYRLPPALAAAIPYELARTLPALERPEEVRALFDREPAARVVFQAADYAAAGRPGIALVEVEAGGHAIVIAAPAGQR